MKTIEKQLKKSNKRLQVLNNHYEKLIELNHKYHYTTSTGLASNPKCEQYLNLLKQIHAEKAGIYMFNRKYNKIYAEQLERAKQSVIGLTKLHLFNLTNPML